MGTLWTTGIDSYDARGTRGVSQDTLPALRADTGTHTYLFEPASRTRPLDWSSCELSRKPEFFKKIKIIQELRNLCWYTWLVWLVGSMG